MIAKRWIFLSLNAFVLMLGSAPIVAQLRPTATNPALTDDQSLDHGRRLLESVRDNVPSFDDPAFYWFCNYVHKHADSRTMIIGAHEQSTAIRTLMERPSDFRGLAVLIEGRVQSHDSYELPKRPGLGMLGQYELFDAASGGMCTIISPLENGTVHVGDHIRVKGYFIKIHSYQTRQGEPGAGPVLVAGSIVKSISPNALSFGQESRNWTGALTGTTAALAILWLMIRRITDHRIHTASKAINWIATSGISNADFDWLIAQQSVKNASPACNHAEQCDNARDRA